MAKVATAKFATTDAVFFGRHDSHSQPSSSRTSARGAGSKFKTIAGSEWTVDDRSRIDDSSVGRREGDSRGAQTLRIILIRCPHPGGTESRHPSLPEHIRKMPLRVMKSLNQVSQTLTDVEFSSLKLSSNLADGHAYQDLGSVFEPIIRKLPTIWLTTEREPIPATEACFKRQFCELINSKAALSHTNFRVCPTASNSIDIVAAFLSEKRVLTALIEPTFDNLSLLLRRRGVQLIAIDETLLARVARSGELEDLPQIHEAGAIFIVNPNNPTGVSLDESSLHNLAEYCRKRGKLLVIDNSFRLFNRRPFDDYELLLGSRVSFIAFEDTGKTWPTMDLKASLVFYSDDNASLFEVLYNELYLCASSISLAVLTQFFNATGEAGLDAAVWSTVDRNRASLREVIAGSALFVPHSSLGSGLSVEWLSCRGLARTDLELCADLRRRGLGVLPGRNFYWAHRDAEPFQHNIRISLLKRRDVFARSMIVLSEFLEQIAAVSDKSYE